MRDAGLPIQLGDFEVQNRVGRDYLVAGQSDRGKLAAASYECPIELADSDVTLVSSPIGLGSPAIHLGPPAQRFLVRNHQ